MNVFIPPHTPEGNVSPELARLAGLLREKVDADRAVSNLIGRRCSDGNIGEFIASIVFNIRLEQSQSKAGMDGRFQSGPFVGSSVNVKTYKDGNKGLDINPKYVPDYYLVLTGVPPGFQVKVFLFEAFPLIAELKRRGRKIQTNTSLKQEDWGNAFDYAASTLLTDKQRVFLHLFD